MPNQIHFFNFRPIQYLALEISAALLGGCASDRAMFVTKTSISILDVDSTPTSLSIAYDSAEGFIGPAYKSGGAPPVIGIMKSDGTAINLHIRQIYATGNAARAIAEAEQDPAERLDFWRKLASWPTFSKGWAGRAAQDLQYASQDLIIPS